MNILQINASARSEGAQSTRLAGLVSARLQAHYPEARLQVRDLARAPHPMMDEATLQALFTTPEQRTPAQAARVALDDILISEIQAAECVVLGVPMYNLMISTQLKNWLDAIARAKVTFRYTENGAEGLLKNKKVYVALARGGVYRDTPQDIQTPYLKMILGFLGMTDVRFVYAEGLAMAEVDIEKTFAGADEQLEALVG